jgi:hypothetical protein
VTGRESATFSQDAFTRNQAGARAAGFDGNPAQHGGGLLNYGVAYLNDSIFTGNTAASCRQYLASLDSNMLGANSASYAGGGIYQDSAYEIRIASSAVSR